MERLLFLIEEGRSFFSVVQENKIRDDGEKIALLILYFCILKIFER